jgi:integrase/recombinase XerD
MSAKLSTTINKMKLLSCKENAEIIYRFFEFMANHDASERHQNNSLKAIISYANYIGNKSLKDVNRKEDVLSYLQTKIKSKDNDPDQKWITTYNDYLHRIKHFFRWLYNQYQKQDIIPMDLWETPGFIGIRPKKTKRLSPYSETEIWEKD